MTVLDNPAGDYPLLGFLPLGFINILWCMVRLGWHMYQAKRRMDRFTQAAGGTADRTRTTQVSKQGIAYVVVYLVVQTTR